MCCCFVCMYAALCCCTHQIQLVACRPCPDVCCTMPYDVNYSPESAGFASQQPSQPEMPSICTAACYYLVPPQLDL